MLKVVVTGGSGRAGRACVADLVAHGSDVVDVDKASCVLGYQPSYAWREQRS